MNIIPGYELIHTKSLESVGLSRLILLIKDGTQYTVDWQRMSTEISSIWIKVGGRGTNTTMIGGIYREQSLIYDQAPINSDHPNNQQARWRKFMNQWKNVTNMKSCWIFGDLNLDVLKWTRPDHDIEPMVDMVKQDVETENFRQLIQGPTHFWPQKASSLIDHIWSNASEKAMNIRNISRAGSDHNVIAARIKLKGEIKAAGEILTRDKSKFVESVFKNELRQTDWSEVFLQSEVNAAYGIMEEKILKTLNKMAPIRKSQIRNKTTPWVSNESKNLITSRNIARQRAVASQRQDDWNNYREIRNKCGAQVRKDRKIFLKNSYENMQQNNDVKGLYGQVKKLAGWKTTGPPAALRMEDEVYKKPKDIANIQCNYYAKKIKDLMNKLPRTTSDPLETLKNAIIRWNKKYQQIQNFKLQPVGITHTLNLLKKVGTSTASGFDTIETNILKIAAEEIASPLNYIINLSMSTSIVPNKWKIGRVIPLWKGKGKDKLAPESYRPVSLLPSLSKIAEKTVQEQMYRHMDTNKLWNPNHHAYRLNHSTTTALSQLTDLMYEASENKQIAIAMSVDETAAFDCINFNVLYQKMELYKFDATTNAWFQNYLQNRSQFVAIGAHSSNFQKLEHGVPQGSILGPTIFNLYINELPDIVNDYGSCSNDNHEPSEKLFNNNCNFCGCLPGYADDAVYVVASTSREWNQERMIIMLDRITKILNANSLSVNKSKTIIQEIMLKQKRCKTKGVPPPVGHYFRKWGEKNYLCKEKQYFSGC